MSGSDPVFYSKRNRKGRISKTFGVTVDDMGLNEGVIDRKDKLVFRSCRYICASWLVQAGVPLLVAKEILGYSIVALAERYDTVILR